MQRRRPTVCNRKPYHPQSLLLQWHVTERCNLRCAHCYQESYSGEELLFQDLVRVLDQFIDLLGLWKHEARGLPVRGHITVTGGEPFVRQDLVAFLEILSVNRERFSFAILTNGSFIDAAMARRLRSLGPSFVQVSMEGTRATHDKIRGQGDFDRTISALKHLVRERIRTFISFTAHRNNFREFTEVARLGRRLRVSLVWADRLIPWGTGSALRKQVLTPKETHEFFEIMHRERRKARRDWLGRTEIGMHRALQFLVAGGKPYSCAAGETLVSVQPNGDLYPCRRMPIRVGNLMETSLVELYYNSDLFRRLRSRHLISDGCEDCFYARLCGGGLRCLSYAVTGDPFKADPGCWLTSSRSREPSIEVISAAKMRAG
jgi:radical SAM protein with 4Fe4S-binding SPASM domain